MWQQIRNNPRAAVLAVLAHIVFIAILVLGFTFSRDVSKSVSGPEMKVIKARAIDETQIDARIKRLHDAVTRRQQKIREQAYRKKQARLHELAQLREKKKHLKAEKKARKRRKQKEAAEKKRAALLKIEQQQHRREEEQKRQQIEQKRIKEKKRKQQEELARQETEMKQKLAADRRQQAAARQQANQREVNKYLGLIKNAVTQHWTLPAQEVKGLHCEVKVRIIPNGEVIDVQIIKSSGNLAFDRSVETAVYRAAPLPVPSIDSGLFNKFREVIFSFEPRDI